MHPVEHRATLGHLLEGRRSDTEMRLTKLESRQALDAFKLEEPVTTQSSWFGVCLTVIVLPLVVVMLTLVLVVQELALPFTITTQQLITSSLIGIPDGDKCGLNITCRSPAGCFVRSAYTARGPTTTCAASNRNQKTDAWTYVEYGAFYSPFLCHSPISNNGIYIAWPRFPFNHMCAIRCPGNSPNETSARQLCFSTFVDTAADGGWYPCPQERNPSNTSSRGGLAGQCFEMSRMWDDYYRPSVVMTLKAMMDPAIACAGLDCAMYPFGASITPSPAKQLSEREWASEEGGQRFSFDRLRGGKFDEYCDVIQVPPPAFIRREHTYLTADPCINSRDCNYRRATPSVSTRRHQSHMDLTWC